MKTHTFASLIRYGLLEIGDGYRAKLDELGGRGLLFLRAGSMTSAGFQWKECDHFGDDLALKLSPKRGHPGDTVVTTKGNSVGRTGYVPCGAPDFVYSPHLSYWRSRDSGQLAPRFLYYWSTSPEFAGQLHALAHGTDMAPYLSLEDQRRLRLSLPSPAIQHAVGSLLGALDDKIAVNDRVAAACHELAVAVYSGEFNTPTVSLSSLCHLRKVQVSPAQMGASKVAHYSLPAYDKGQVPEVVDPNTILSAKFAITSPSVLISKLNPVTPRVWRVFPDDHTPCIASTEYLVLEPTEGVDTSEIRAVAMQESFLAHIASLASGTSNSHQRVSPSELIAASVFDPRKIRDGVRQQVVALTNRADSARAESTSLAAARDTLLPRLISGEVRIKDAERVVSDAV